LASVAASRSASDQGAARERGGVCKKRMRERKSERELANEKESERAREKESKRRSEKTKCTIGRLEVN